MTTLDDMPPLNSYITKVHGPSEFTRAESAAEVCDDCGATEYVSHRGTHRRALCPACYDKRLA